MDGQAAKISVDEFMANYKAGTGVPPEKAPPVSGKMSVDEFMAGYKTGVPSIEKPAEKPAAVPGAPTMLERGKEAVADFFRPSFAPEPTVPAGMERMPESAIPTGMSMDIPTRRGEISGRLGQIDTELAESAKAFETTKALPENFKAASDNIENLKTQLEGITSQAVNDSLPPDLYEQYTALRPQYEKAIEDYNASINDFNLVAQSGVDAHNAKIAEAQELMGEWEDLEQQEYGAEMMRPVSTITGEHVPTFEEKAAGGRAAMAIVPYGFASVVRGMIPGALERAVMDPITKAVVGKEYVSPIDEALKIGKYLPEAGQVAIGAPAHMAGMIAPLRASSQLAGALMEAVGLPLNLVLRTGPVMDRITGHIIHGGLTGAAYGALEAGTPKGMAEDAAFFCALEGGLGAVGGIFRKIFSANWYRSLEVKERGLVVQSLDDMLDRGYSEGEILKQWNNPMWRGEALARRAVREPPLEPAAPGLSETQRDLAKEVIREKMAEQPLVPAIPEEPIPVVSPMEIVPGVPPVMPEPMPELPPGQGFELVEPEPETRLRPGPEKIIGPEYPEGAEYVAERPAPEELVVEHKPVLGSHGLPWKRESNALKAFESKRLKDMGITEETHEVVPVKNGFGIARKTEEVIEPEVVPEIETKPEVAMPEEVPTELEKMSLPELLSAHEKGGAFNLENKEPETTWGEPCRAKFEELTGEKWSPETTRKAKKGIVPEVEKPEKPIVEAFPVTEVPAAKKPAEVPMSSELRELHDHKARALGFEKAGGSFVEGYLKKLAKVAEKTDMSAAMAAYEALSEYKKGNINQASLEAEKILGKLHKAEVALRVEKEPVAEVLAKEPWGMTRDEWVDGHIKSPAMHREHVLRALKSGKLTSEKYAELHEKDYGPLPEFMPEAKKVAELDKVTGLDPDGLRQKIYDMLNTELADLEAKGISKGISARITQANAVESLKMDGIILKYPGVVKRALGYLPEISTEARRAELISKYLKDGISREEAGEKADVELAKKPKPEVVPEVEKEPVAEISEKLLSFDDWAANQPAGERNQWIRTRLNEQDIPLKPTSVRGKSNYQNAARKAAKEFDEIFKKRYQVYLEKIKLKAVPKIEKELPSVYRPRGLKDAIELRKETGSLETYDLQSQAEWLGDKHPPKDGKLTLYRATPTGEEIKPGDYVTNDLAYAKLHIKANLGGKGKIAKIEAILDDIFPADASKEFWYAPKSIEKEPISETKSRLLENIKSEKGSSELINDLSRLGADIMKRGHTTYKAFTAEMKTELSSVWEKIKSLIRKAYFAAKKIIATVKRWNEKPDTWEVYDKENGEIVDVFKPGENKIDHADIDILLGIDKRWGIRKAKKIPVEMLPRIIKSERGAVEIGKPKPKPKPEVGREVISKDGTTVDWDKSKVITKEKVTRTCYATYNKDGSFKKWRTREAINKIKVLKK
ncbi:hypothetical protein KAW18_01345, partial [candidate division WOR-3 bacterium]|nr:hypothetical protein [candidate division WOR-3 bacterium]